MNGFDHIEFAKEMGVLIREAVEPLHKRIEELEAALSDVPEPPKLSDLIAHEGLKSLVDLQVTEYLTENPPPAGEKGADGKDGAGIADLLIDREGALVATMTDGRMKSLGKVVGADGAKGADGKDGADFSDAELDYDGERGLIVRGKNVEMVKRLPIPMDRGYYREGMKAEKGDILTHDGNAWLALKDTSAKPCTENKDDWRIFARKGRDGRDGKDGKPPPGPVRLNADA